MRFNGQLTAISQAIISLFGFSVVVVAEIYRDAGMSWPVSILLAIMPLVIILVAFSKIPLLKRLLLGIYYGKIKYIAFIMTPITYFSVSVFGEIVFSLFPDLGIVRSAAFLLTLVLCGHFYFTTNLDWLFNDDDENEEFVAEAHRKEA